MDKIIYKLERFCDHPVYIVFVLFVIIPIDIWLITIGSVIFGIVLLATQVPWGLRQLCRLAEHLDDKS